MCAQFMNAAPNNPDDGNRYAMAFPAPAPQLVRFQPLVTWGLIAACAAVFILELAKGAGFDTMSPELAIRLGANYGPMTLAGQWWRLFTSMFLHFGFLHIALNMWCLWVLGMLAERLMGRAAFLLLYVATGIAGSLLSLAIHPQLVSAGASGAIFGVAGGLVTYLWMQRDRLNYAAVMKQLKSLAIFLGINLIYSFGPGIDMMAHAGGVLAGLAIGAALPIYLKEPGAQSPPSPIMEEVSGNKRITQVAIVCAVLLLVGAVGVRRLQGDNAFVIASLDQIDTGHSAEVLPRLEQTVKQKPNSALAHFALGAAYLRMNRLADALRELQTADTLGPGNATFQHQLGVAYLEQGEFDNAMSKFQQSIANGADDTSNHLGLAEALLGNNQYGEAIVEANKVIAASPNSAEAYSVLGEAEVWSGTVDVGLQELEKSVQLAPNNADLRMILIKAYLFTGHADKANAMKAQMANSGSGPGAAPRGQEPNAH